LLSFLALFATRLLTSTQLFEAVRRHGRRLLWLL